MKGLVGSKKICNEDYNWKFRDHNIGIVNHGHNNKVQTECKQSHDEVTQKQGLMRQKRMNDYIATINLIAVVYTSLPERLCTFP